MHQRIDSVLQVVLNNKAKLMSVHSLGTVMVIHIIEDFQLTSVKKTEAYCSISLWGVVFNFMYLWEHFSEIWCLRRWYYVQRIHQIATNAHIIHKMLSFSSEIQLSSIWNKSTYLHTTDVSAHQDHRTLGLGKPSSISASKLYLLDLS